MGVKLLWTGLTILSANQVLKLPAASEVGGVFMVIGMILMWLDK